MKCSWRLRYGVLTAMLLLSGVAATALSRIMMAGGGGPSPAGVKSGVHIPPGTQINFNYNLTDGAGFLWDLQYYGTVGQGTNNSYGGGMYCQINGNNLSSNGQGWVNKDNDEIEIGPHNTGTVQVYRRVKVYKDRGLARWMDIFENSTDKDVTIPVRVYSNLNWSISKTTGSSGGANFGAKDFAFITEANTGGGFGNNGGPGPLLHIVCSPKAKLRPTVQVNGNTITVLYNVVVKAKQTAILCYFESQGKTVADHQKTLKNFQAYKMLRDLPASVRKLILNVSADSALYDELNLERSEQGDMIVQASGEPLFGKINNASFTLDTPALGEIKLQADQVIGMVAATTAEVNSFRVLLKDGQMLRGALRDANLRVNRDGQGEELQIPTDRLRQWSYRISKDSPYEIPFAGPALQLRTGDRLLYDPKKVQLSLRTPYGLVPLKAADLQVIRMDNASNGLHRVVFANGSTLGGMLEPEQISADTTFGRKLDIPRNMVRQVQFTQDDAANPILSKAVLTNNDELMGDLVDAKIRLVTEFGAVELKPDHIKTITADAGSSRRAAVQLWDGSIVRGRLDQDDLSFELMPGPTLKIPPEMFVSLARVQMMPPQDVARKVQQLVAQFSGEALKDRQAAAEELQQMGESIIPMLQKQLNNHDLEVRQRIQEVIDRIGGKNAPPPPVPSVFEGLRG